MRLTLVEEPHKRAMLETKMRYAIHVDGVKKAELYYNMRGYCCNPGIPLYSGGFRDIGERSITAFRKEIAKLNREAKAYKAEKAKEAAS